MTVPAIGPAESPARGGLPCPDPYGLWEAPGAVETGRVSFGDLDAASAEAGVAAVWRLPLSSNDLGAGNAELDRRACQLAAIEAGLTDAGARLDAFLDQRRQPGSAGQVSFGLEETPARLPAAEADLSLALAAIEQLPASEDAVQFGLGENAAAAVGVDWNGLQARFNALMDSVNRQLLHAAWVETTLDGRLVARTTITWGGDLTTHMLPALDARTLQAHQVSLRQAIASEAANMKTVLTVAQLAGKITLAVTTPMGAVQALALGWQFLRTVISE